MSSDAKLTFSNVRKFRLFPQSLGACVAHIAKPVLKKHGLEVELLKEWPHIVGKDVANYSQPVKFSRGKDGKGTLIVDVLQSHALVAQHLQPLMLERLAIYHGSRAVERIKFQQKTSLSGVTYVEEFSPTPQQEDMLKQFEKLKQNLQ